MDENNILNIRLEQMKRLIKVKPEPIFSKSKEQAYRNITKYIRRRMGQITESKQIDTLANLIERSSALSDDEKISLLYELDSIEENLYLSKYSKQEIGIGSVKPILVLSQGSSLESEMYKRRTMDHNSTFGWDFFVNKISKVETLAEAFNLRKLIQASVICTEEQKSNLCFRLDGIADNLMK